MKTQFIKPAVAILLIVLVNASNLSGQVSEKTPATSKTQEEEAQSVAVERYKNSVGRKGIDGLDYDALLVEISEGRSKDARSRLLLASGAKGSLKADESRDLAIILMDILAREDFRDYARTLRAIVIDLADEAEESFPIQLSSDEQRQALSLIARLHDRFLNDPTKAAAVYAKLIVDAGVGEPAEKAFSDLAKGRIASIDRREASAAKIVADAKLKEKPKSDRTP